MSAEIQLPDYLKGLVDESTKDMITQVGGGVPRISIRGRQFRTIIDGEETHKQTDPLHVIVMGVVPEAHMAKTFYIDGYQPGSSDPPDCSSFFGIEPDTWVDKPQSATCRECAQNKWGSAVAMSGKKAKACKDSKRLMVLLGSDLKGEEEAKIFIFNVTIASLKALTTYGKFLVTNKLPMAAVITEIAFVDSEFPQVEFNFKGVLSEVIGTKMLERATNKEWLEGMDVPVLPGGQTQTAKRLAPPEEPANKTTEKTAEKTAESNKEAVVDNDQKNVDDDTQSLLGEW